MKKYRTVAATIAVAGVLGFGSGHEPASAETVCTTVSWAGNGDSVLQSGHVFPMIDTGIIVPAGNVTSATWVSSDGYDERVTAVQEFEQWAIEIDGFISEFTTDLPDSVRDARLAGSFDSFDTDGGTLRLMHRSFVDGSNDGTANSVRPLSVELTVCNEVTPTTSTTEAPTTTEPPTTIADPTPTSADATTQPTVVDLTTKLPETGPSGTTRSLLAIGLAVFGFGVLMRMNQSPTARR